MSCHAACMHRSEYAGCLADSGFPQYSRPRLYLCIDINAGFEGPLLAVVLPGKLARYGF
ncbi:hypothetical protein CI102_15332 [Trichoderma harzianum]|nr:hypothetical protein CI102_15332 [Trichoderma harzianum]